MFNMMLVAHLLGDYLFQFNFIARWKARSLWGVVAHGAIVTVTTWLCALLLDPAWWGYALLIGGIHTAIDVIRARLIRTHSATEDLIYYLIDQATHLAVIGLVIQISGRGASLPSAHPLAQLITSRLLGFFIGYLLLLQPSWVLLRFLVRGIWGEAAAPHLGAGEKFEPMLERVLIATCVLLGQFYLVPLILLPRRVNVVQVQNNGVSMWMKLTTHWAETFMSVLLAVSVGLLLRILLLSY